MVPVKGERSCNDGLASENSYRYRQPCRQIAAAKHAAFTELLFFFFFTSHTLLGTASAAAPSGSAVRSTFS